MKAATAAGPRPKPPGRRAGRQSGEGSRGAESQRPDGTGPNGSEQPGQGGSLADRQQALRQQLQRQRDGLPYMDGEAGDAAVKRWIVRAVPWKAPKRRCAAAIGPRH